MCVYWRSQNRDMNIWIGYLLFEKFKAKQINYLCWINSRFRKALLFNINTVFLSMHRLNKPALT